MKYNLSNLTKYEINEIIKSLSPSFDGIYCYGISGNNKVVKENMSTKEDVVELYDDNKKLHDIWGEYHPKNNSLFVMAWDGACFWQVGVYLYEDHFEIPKYRNAVFYKYETEENFEKYRNTLAEIFKNKIVDAGLTQ